MLRSMAVFELCRLTPRTALPLQERSRVKQLTGELQAAQLRISELEAHLNLVSLRC